MTKYAREHRTANGVDATGPCFRFERALYRFAQFVARNDSSCAERIQVLGGFGSAGDRRDPGIVLPEVQLVADADLVVCRAGASTVTEIAAVGAAAMFVPFPFAVDDHQTTNAKFLVDQGGGWLLPQSELSAQGLATLLQNTNRDTLLERALNAKKMEKVNATREVVAACEELSS